MFRARWDGEVLTPTGEIWRKVDEAPEYSVSSFGRVRRDDAFDRLGRRVPTAGRIIRPRTANRRTEHLVVTLSSGGRRLDRLVHRLVADAFLGPPPEGCNFVCHVDGDATHNHAPNLYWGNGTTNAHDRTMHGRTLRGSQVGGSKLTPEDVLAIRKARGSQRQIGETFGVSQANIQSIRARKTWRHLP